MEYRLIFDDTDDELVLQSTEIPRVGDSYWVRITDDTTFDELEKQKCILIEPSHYVVRRVNRDLEIKGTRGNLEGKIVGEIEVTVTRE